MLTIPTIAPFSSVARDSGHFNGMPRTRVFANSGSIELGVVKLASKAVVSTAYNP